MTYLALCGLLAAAYMSRHVRLACVAVLIFLAWQSFSAHAQSGQFEQAGVCSLGARGFYMTASACQEFRRMLPMLQSNPEPASAIQTCMRQLDMSQAAYQMCVDVYLAVNRQFEHPPQFGGR